MNYMVWLKEMAALLSPSERRKILMVIPLSMIGTVLEMASLGVLMPAVYIMIKPNILDAYPGLASFMDLAGNPSQFTLVLVGVFSIISIYLIKTIFLALLCWDHSKLIYNIKANLSSRLYQSYLKQPWVFHTQSNSAVLISNTIQEVHLFVLSVISSIMLIVIEGVLCLGIVVILFIIQPLGTLLVVGIVGILSYVIRYVTANRIMRWGKARQYHDAMRIQEMQQGLGAVKEIKLMGIEDYFLNRFNYHNYSAAHVNERSETLVHLPRLWFELLAVISLTMLILLMYYQGKSPEFIIPVVGVFSAAAFRLLPSINRLLNAIHNLTYSLPAGQILNREFQRMQDTSFPKRTDLLEFKKQITIEGIYYRYPNTEVDVLKNINMKIPVGSSIGFSGLSGAGKSTLVDILIGLIAPSKGQIKIDGIDIQSNLRGWQDQIGFVPQTIYLIDASIRSNIAFGIPEELINDDTIKKIIKDTQLEELILSLPDGLDTIVGERGVKLSGGQRQRIGIARALYRDPSVIVFDESTNALDSTTEKAIMDSLYSLKGTKTLIIVAHRLSTMDRCNYIYKFENGEIVADGVFSSIKQQFHKLGPVGSLTNKLD